MSPWARWEALAEMTYASNSANEVTKSTGKTIPETTGAYETLVSKRRNVREKVRTLSRYEVCAKCPQIWPCRKAHILFLSRL